MNKYKAISVLAFWMSILSCTTVSSIMSPDATPLPQNSIENSPEIIPTLTKIIETSTTMATITGTNTPLPTLTHTITPKMVLVDDFNNGKICNIWNVLSNNNSRIVEEDGFLKYYITAGDKQSNNSQNVGIISKEYLLKKDFIIQIDFHVNEEYHNNVDSNTKFILWDRKGYGIEVSIRNGKYMTIEVPPQGYGIVHNEILTRDIVGKLRIERKINLVRTSYWKDGWITMAEWSLEHVSGDLQIDIDSWNMPPNYGSFNLKLDNLRSDKELGTNCI